MTDEEYYEMTCEEDARATYQPPQTTLTAAQLAAEPEEPDEWFGYDIDK